MHVSIVCLPILDEKLSLSLNRSGDEKVAAVAPRVGCHHVLVGSHGYADYASAQNMCAVDSTIENERAALEREIDCRDEEMPRSKNGGVYSGIKFSVRSDGEF